MPHVVISNKTFSVSVDNRSHRLAFSVDRVEAELNEQRQILSLLMDIVDPTSTQLVWLATTFMSATIQVLMRRGKWKLRTHARIESVSSTGQVKFALTNAAAVIGGLPEQGEGVVDAER